PLHSMVSKNGNIDTISRIQASKILNSNARAGIRFTSPDGCEHCGQTGNTGRRVIAEMLSVGDNVLNALQKEDSLELFNAWRSSHDDDVALGKSLRDKATELLIIGLLCPLEFESKFGFIE
ncbi:hypothetical protein L4C33_21820, partial [Vibrio makurazakiensis]|uniref:ATPase, T2SS/T4P/T4SS family n=1 Tax=Vibrio makurazakiensis TaxID=2910250 RepID=UPI003D0D3FAB